MGRLKKYLTQEQQDKALRDRQMKYYWKNQEDINNKNKERYHNKINGSLPPSSSTVSQSFTITKLI